MKNSQRGFVPVVIIILVLALLAVVGYVTADKLYFSKPHIVKKEVQIPKAKMCEDSDGKDIFQAGKVKFSYETPEPNKIKYGSIGDVCDVVASGEQGEDVVRESYCSDNDEVIDEYWTCGKGASCRQGRCVTGGSNLPRCTDTDGGINTQVAGVVNINGVETPDKCWVSLDVDPEKNGGFVPDCKGSGCYAYEYYCTEYDTREYKIIPAVSGCKE